MKHCKRCDTLQPTENFYVTKQGLYSYCKACTKSAVAAWHKANPERSAVHKRNTYLRHRAKDPNAFREHRREYVAANAEKIRQYKLEWDRQHPRQRNRDPAKMKARSALNDRIRRGIIARPATCSTCGQRGRRIEAHHPDHSQPLLVVWLCTACHGKTWRK